MCRIGWWTRWHVIPRESAYVEVDILIDQLWGVKYIDCPSCLDCSATSPPSFPLPYSQRRGLAVDELDAEPFPSLAAQVLTWIEAANPGHVTGNHFVGVGAYHGDGPLDVPALQAALNDLVADHRILRTVLWQGPDCFLHRPLPTAPVPLRVVDLPVGTDPAGRELPEALAREVCAREHPADRAPVLWAALGRHTASRWTMVLIGHHGAVDHWSMELLIRDLAWAYDARLRGRPPALTVRQYEDSARSTVSRTSHGRIDAGRVEGAVAYWQRLLTDIPRITQPVVDAGPFSAETRFTLTVDRAELAAVSARARTTPFVSLLTAYALALSAAAGTDEVVVPLFTSGRERTDWETVGPFMNVAAVRVNFQGDHSLPEAIERTRQAFVAALAHEVPLAALLPAVPGVAALFSKGGVPVGGFELVQFPPPEPVPLSLDRLPIGPRYGATVLPISGLLCWLQADVGNTFAGTIRFRPGLLDAGWVANLVSRLAQNLDAITSLRRASVHAA